MRFFQHIELSTFCKDLTQVQTTGRSSRLSPLRLGICKTKASRGIIHPAPVLFFSNFILYPEENSVEERVQSGFKKNPDPIVPKVFFLFGKYLLQLTCRMGQRPGKSSSKTSESLTNPSKKWPWAGKLWELLPQRTSWNWSFFKPCLNTCFYACF